MRLSHRNLFSFFIILVLFAATNTANGQTPVIDSLIHQLETAKEDTLKVRMLNHLAFRFYRIKPDTTVSLASAGLELANSLNYEKGAGTALQRIGLGYNSLGEVEKAIEYNQQSLTTFRSIGDSSGVSGTLLNLGSSYYGQGRFDELVAMLS